MGRSLSTALQAQVSAEANKIAFLVELNLSTIIRATDFYTDIVYDSENYQAGGSYLAVDTTQETGELKVDEMNITFSNVTDEVRALINTGAYIDKSVNVYIAFMDSSDALVGAINYFTGKIRSVSIAESTSDSKVSIVVANHWSNWNLTKGRHYSDESQQNFSSGDKGLEYATQTKSDVRWGS